RNRGTVTIRNLLVQLIHDDPSAPAELARASVPMLDPGASQVVTLSWKPTLTGDSVPLAVRLDPFDVLTELSEDNNRADAAVRVRPSSLPNLVVSGADLSFSPEPPLEGQAASVTALVRNTGAVDSGAFRVQFYRGNPETNGVLISEESAPTIAAHSSAA